MNSTQNIYSIFDILKLLSECYYNNSSILLMSNQNHLENRFLVVLKEVNHSDHCFKCGFIVNFFLFLIFLILFFSFHPLFKKTFSLDYEPQWYNQIKQVIISSENEKMNAPHDNINLQIFLDLFKNMCRILGGTCDFIIFFFHFMEIS
jgi:hypothetical protein